MIEMREGGKLITQDGFLLATQLLRPYCSVDCAFSSLARDFYML